MLKQALSNLKLTVGDLELVAPSDSEVLAIADVARSGIHPETYMPFSTPWSEGGPDARAEAIATWMVRSRDSSHPGKWVILLGVRRGTEWLGSTNLNTEDFPSNRQVSTGSWLGERFQGAGVGKAMRAAMLTLAFEGLGARLATSEAFEDNGASRKVNESHGYRQVGHRIVARREQPAKLIQYELTCSEWRSMRRLDVTMSGHDGLRSALEF